MDNEEDTLLSVYILEDGTCTLKVKFHSLSQKANLSVPVQRRGTILRLDTQENMDDSTTAQNIWI